jgi:hypothetical protein
MKKSPHLALLIFLLFIPFACWATGISGELETSLSASVDDLSIYRKNLRLDIELEAAENDTEFKAILRAENDSIKIANPASVEIREAYVLRSFLINGPINALSLKAGKLIHTWGNADEFKPCDILNPQDLSYILMKPIQERKQAILSGVLSLNVLERIYLELTAIPAFEPSAYANSKVFVPVQLRDLESNPLVTVAPASLPPETLRHASIGFRAGAAFLGIDTHFNFYKGFDTLPTFETLFVPTMLPPFYSLSVTPRFKEVLMFGLDIQRALFLGISTRLEMAWFEKGKEIPLSQKGNNPALTPYFLNVMSGGTGNKGHRYGEYTFGMDTSRFFISDLYLNVQLNQKIISEWNADLSQEEIVTSFLGSLEYSLWNRRIKIRTSAFYCLNDAANALGADSTFRLSGNLDLSAGVWLMDGPSDSMYGQFKDKDLFHVECTLVF